MNVFVRLCRRPCLIAFPVLVSASHAIAGGITISNNSFIASQSGCVTILGGNCSQAASNSGDYESTAPVSALVAPPAAEANYAYSNVSLGYFSNFSSANAVGAFSVPKGTNGGTLSASGGTSFIAGYVCSSDGNWCGSGINAGASGSATFSTQFSVDTPTYFSLTYSGAAGTDKASVSTGNSMFAWFGDFQDKTSITKSGVLQPGRYSIQVESAGYANTCADTPCIADAYGVADFYLTLTLSEARIAPRVAKPAFSAPGGVYKGEKKLAITSTTSGAKIHYTTDGSLPTTASPEYTGPITLSESRHINAIAVATGYSDSGGISASYVIEPPTNAPIFTPKAGTYTSAQKVEISDSTPDATIYYTTDGTTPTLNSTIYTGPIHVTASETIKAIGIASDDTASPTTTGKYTIKP